MANFFLSCSDMERDLHLFPVSCQEKPKLLCFFLILLQWHNHFLPLMCLWLPEQEQLRQVSFTFFISSIHIYQVERIPKITWWMLIFYRSNSKILQMKGINTPRKDNTPLLQCTHHMCPVRVHWHLKQNYKDYWRVKIAITNFNYKMNYTLWSLVVQHPNLNNVTQVFSFDYKPLLPYESISKWQ